MKLSRLLSLLLLTVLLAGCAQPTAVPTAEAQPTVEAAAAPQIRVETVWGRPSPMIADAGAFYMIIHNDGLEADRLISATAATSACGKVELHTTTQDSAGNSVMAPVEAIDVPAGGSVELKPGGLHLMCTPRSADFKPGQGLDIELTFEKAGLVATTAALRWEAVPVPAESIKVFTPGALTEAAKALGKAFQAAGGKVAFEMGHSPTHRMQIAEGAPGDVFMSASEKDMTEAATAGLVIADQVRTFATNRLIVILPAGNPGNIQSLEDLARSGLKLIIAAPEVPVGKYTDTVLGKLDAKFGGGYKDNLLANVISKELGVAPIVSKIKLGEADAGIVYVSDAAIAPELDTLPIPDEQNLLVKFTIAPLSTARLPAEAQKFIDFVMSDEGQAVLQSFGFLPGIK